MQHHQQNNTNIKNVDLYRTGFAHPAVEYVTVASVEQGKEGWALAYLFTWPVRVVSIMPKTTCLGETSDQFT